eukprot:TRINITY_DN1986_c1_g1_i1.p1 TRINITY_DN1986_c1_g1~~TRINITY_DN1986_c1_g1_i1.p1  ORF type:complete len:432 (+),score=30.16 TRINITY_DN1986_c1_g1_i1:133-1428(+)
MTAADCVFFSRDSCSKGDECPFRHNGPASRNPVVCRFWKRDQNCTNSSCPYSHPASAAGSSVSQRGASHYTGGHVPVAAERDRSTIPCYWLANGGCSKGSECLYSHAGQGSSAITQTSIPGSGGVRADSTANVPAVKSLDEILAEKRARTAGERPGTDRTFGEHRSADVRSRLGPRSRDDGPNRPQDRRQSEERPDHSRRERNGRSSHQSDNDNRNNNRNQKRSRDTSHEPLRQATGPRRVIDETGNIDSRHGARRGARGNERDRDRQRASGGESHGARPERGTGKGKGKGKGNEKSRGKRKDSGEGKGSAPVRVKTFSELMAEKRAQKGQSQQRSNQRDSDEQQPKKQRVHAPVTPANTPTKGEAQPSQPQVTVAQAVAAKLTQSNTVSKPVAPAPPPAAPKPDKPTPSKPDTTNDAVDADLAEMEGLFD